MVVIVQSLFTILDVRITPKFQNIRYCRKSAAVIRRCKMCQIAVIVLIGLVWIANALVGNPVSKMLA